MPFKTEITTEPFLVWLHLAHWPSMLKNRLFYVEYDSAVTSSKTVLGLIEFKFLPAFNVLAVVVAHTNTV